MKITFMTLQKASIVCLGVGMFLALGSAGTFETTGEIQTGVCVPAGCRAAYAFELCPPGLRGEAAQDPQGPARHREEAKHEAEGRLTMFHTTVKCVDCGALMVDVPSNTKRCAVCRVGHNRESVRKANKTRRAEEAVRPKPRSLDDDLEAMNKYNEQRRAAGREPLTYGVWRSRGAPEEYA